MISATAQHIVGADEIKTYIQARIATGGWAGPSAPFASAGDSERDSVLQNG